MMTHARAGRSFLWGALAAVALVVAVVALPATQASQPADRIEGTWLNGKGDGKVEISRCDGHYCGRIVWLTVPGVDVPRDIHNPDPSLRHRRIEGLQVISGLSFAGDSTWSGGTIYDPRSGNTYSFKASLKGNDVLKLRGYVLLPLFGRTETWHRVQPPPPSERGGAGARPTPEPTPGSPPGGSAGRAR
jgi:uncharacterized protein (DUF2147 family)